MPTLNGRSYAAGVTNSAPAIFDGVSSVQPKIPGASDVFQHIRAGSAVRRARRPAGRETVCVDDANGLARTIDARVEEGTVVLQAGDGRW